MDVRATSTIILFLGLISCSGPDCSNFPTKFETHEEAIELVESADFEFSDNIATPESSWVRAGAFFSCGGSTGFFVLTTKKGKFIHQDVPKEMWDEFKTSESHGSYYNENISGQYPLQVGK